MESTPLLRSCKPCHRVVSVVLNGFLDVYFYFGKLIEPGLSVRVVNPPSH
jgi:hypothetical protein